MSTSNGEEKNIHAHDHSMKCNEVVDKVYAFLDGELNLDEVLVFKDHLKMCLPCQAYVQFEEKLIQIIKSKCVSCDCQVPPGLMDKIRKAIALSNTSSKS